MSTLIRILQSSACAALLVAGSFSQAAPGTFALGDKEFLLNGKPHLVRAGELHYPRIPREYWDHRIKMCKAMGMNTICIYVFWNFHEPREGEFDFTGQRDVAEFVRLIQKNGMHAIVRPGPYCCAEWDMGGLPWWLLKKDDIKVRSSADSYYLERMEKWLAAVGRELAPLQIQNGGPILMVQVENEYALFGKDNGYMTRVRDGVRKAGFDKVRLFRCDWASNFDAYQVDDVAVTVNFGAGSRIDDMFRKFSGRYPTAPRMCSEYWTGWFDHWGRNHETRGVDSFIGSLRDMMEKRISFSLYMAHGGTSFGQWGGANAPPYSAMVSSYDYNAPINEAGQPTDKFFAVRDLLGSHLNPGETLAPVPVSNPVITIPEFGLNECAPLFDNLPPAIRSNNVKPMESFDLGWGRILYRTRIPADTTRDSRLRISDVHDWALVYLDGKRIGKLDRRLGEDSIKLPAAKAGARLDILVEAMGRVNFGGAVIDRKGITGSVRMVGPNGEAELTGWSVFPIDVDAPLHQNIKFGAGKVAAAAYHRGQFTLEKTGDTFLDLRAWGKGMVWVNGHNLGRYWSLGPQQTMYLPGCWLKKGRNEVIVLDLEGNPDPRLAGLEKPILDDLRPDASLLNRKPGQSLTLDGETPAASGDLAPGADWQTVRFPAPVSGRYLCFSATSPQRNGDPFSSMAEFHLLDSEGQTLPRDSWAVLYADSEEISAGNHNAGKIFDLQESTFWHTSWKTAKRAPFPHSIVIDLGATANAAGFKILPRTDKETNGMIKGYRIYLKDTPFKY